MLNKEKDKFYILKDSNNNDVIYISKKNMIYTNLKDTKFEYQFYLFSKYINQGICSIYNVNNDITLVKQEIKKEIYWYLKNKDKMDLIYNLKEKEVEKECAIYFNEYYLALATLEYGAGIDEFIIGYDMEKNKYLDFDNHNTEDNIYKYLVEIRGLSKENLLYLLNNEICDENMIFNFMSFIFDKKINKDNYIYYLKALKRYILKIYPDIKKDDSKNIYYFHRKDKKIDNLKYQKEKTYVMKK